MRCGIRVRCGATGGTTSGPRAWDGPHSPSEHPRYHRHGARAPEPEIFSTIPGRRVPGFCVSLLTRCNLATTAAQLHCPQALPWPEAQDPIEKRFAELTTVRATVTE